MCGRYEFGSHKVMERRSFTGRNGERHAHDRELGIING